MYDNCNYVFKIAIFSPFVFSAFYNITSFHATSTMCSLLPTQCIYQVRIFSKCRFQWPRGIRCRSAAARLPRSWVRIQPGAWMFVCCECYVLSGRGLCDELITRPEESYRLCCVVVHDLETSRMRRPLPALGRSATEKKMFFK